MKIFLHEIKEQDTDLDFTQDEKWVADAVARVDETYDGEGNVRAPRQTSRPVQTHLNLRKVDDVVVISGNIDTNIQLVCSRCANYFAFGTRPRFSSLFCKDPVMAGVGHFTREGSEHKPAGQNYGWARHAHDDSDDSESNTGKDLDITYISQDFIDLADVLTEQLRLQVPFQPLCREDCKGICSQCGADLNQGRCACSKLTKQTPFSMLKDFKVN
jgi:uncharacterized protein